MWLISMQTKKSHNVQVLTLCNAVIKMCYFVWKFPGHWFITHKLYQQNDLGEFHFQKSVFVYRFSTIWSISILAEHEPKLILCKTMYNGMTIGPGSWLADGRA